MWKLLKSEPSSRHFYFYLQLVKTPSLFFFCCFFAGLTVIKVSSHDKYLQLTLEIEPPTVYSLSRWKINLASNIFLTEPLWKNLLLPWMEFSFYGYCMQSVFTQLFCHGQEATQGNFKWSTADLNSEFSIPKTVGCRTKTNGSVYPTIYPYHGAEQMIRFLFFNCISTFERIDEFMPFPKALAENEMQTVSSRSWTRLPESISHIDNSYSIIVMCLIHLNLPQGQMDRALNENRTK